VVELEGLVESIEAWPGEYSLVLLELRHLGMQERETMEGDSWLLGAQ
jgi:hypothetical protein